MIQANELRIGNLVKLKNEQAVEIEMIWEYGINEDSSYGDAGSFSLPKYEKEEIYPIPLTPEILEKCGFERGEYGGFVKNYFSWSLGVFCMCDGSFLVKCEYLHQLQNLYFALTGEELTINL